MPLFCEAKFAVSVQHTVHAARSNAQFISWLKPGCFGWPELSTQLNMCFSTSSPCERAVANPCHVRFDRYLPHKYSKRVLKDVDNVDAKLDDIKL